MAISDRYFVFEPPNPYIRMAENPIYGNGIAENTYIDVPFLCLGSYPSYSGAGSARAGICYWIKSIDKFHIVRGNGITVGISPCTYGYFNGKPVWHDFSKSEFIYYGYGAVDNDQNNVPSAMWCRNTDIPYRYANLGLPSVDQKNGYKWDATDGRTNRTLCFYRYTDMPENGPEINHSYTGYATYIADNTQNNSYTSELFNLSNNSAIYTRDENAVDLTPEELMPFGEPFAGIWKNSSGTQIYLGTPIFEFSSDMGKWKMMPMIKPYTSETLKIPNDTGGTTNQYITTYYSMTGYDGNHELIQRHISEGSIWIYEWAFDYDKREENGGYWRAEKNSSPIYDIQEETVIPTLQWVSLDGETQHSDLTNGGYAGSVLQSGIFEKYCQIDERKEAYKRYIIKASGLPYFYEEDEEVQQ